MSDNLDKKNNGIPFILLLIALCILGVGLNLKSFISDYQEQQIAEKSEPVQNPPKDSYQGKEIYTPNVQTGIKSITINPPMEFNYLSKSEIYSIRTRFVNESIFADSSYYPSEEVFGQIESGKPWWGLKNYACHKKDTISGVSAVSRYVNNPAILLAPMNAYGYTNVEDYGSKYLHYCSAKYTKYMPVELFYDNDKKTITAKYQINREVIEHPDWFGGSGLPYFLTLVGLNARDLGYRYIKIIGLNNVKMISDYNASQHVYTLADFIHVGGSCGVSGGCNNISPRQTELEFSIYELPASININLWHNFPNNDSETPDMKYKIVFEETLE